MALLPRSTTAPVGVPPECETVPMKRVYAKDQLSFRVKDFGLQPDKKRSAPNPVLGDFGQPLLFHDQ
ncbi:hypothetical protein R1T40_15955 [Tritonibacter scottomollicae]|uniref:Uncharacterized protein n=1 Tax=Tritonibacter scottomollicae TaxID=483013 RepID=A0ABZ0HE49_TRISK|nr:hypothetical protein R1T40_15955 [Tritonibacter scottomollicae]